jgi:hypothetical protein
VAEEDVPVTIEKQAPAADDPEEVDPADRIEEAVNTAPTAGGGQSAPDAE